jgi:peptide/nickel transport system permease protein
MKQKTKLNEWLMSDAPSSRAQAWCGKTWRGWKLFSRNPLAMSGLLIILALLFLSLFGPALAPQDPFAQTLDLRLSAPGTHGFILGSDDLGRDILSRVLYGTRITLTIAVLVAIVVAPLGLAIGTIAGYFGGVVDTVLMRITDVFLAFPRLILALALVSVLGPGIENAVIAIAITTWPPYARVARAETITLRKSDFIAAARLQGASSFRIITGQIIPLCTSSVIVRVTLDMAGIILTAAGLGCLGLGAQPPSPEWGAMVAGGRSFLLDQWWVSAMPGFAICIVSLGFNFLGDGIRDVLDPKNRS